MPQNTTKTATSSWSQATDADVTSVSLHNKSSRYLEVAVTVGAVAPTNADTTILVPPYGYILNENLSDLAPGLTGANRVYVKGQGEYFVSHA